MIPFEVSFARFGNRKLLSQLALEKKFFLKDKVSFFQPFLKDCLTKANQISLLFFFKLLIKALFFHHCIKSTPLFSPTNPWRLDKFRLRWHSNSEMSIYVHFGYFPETVNKKHEKTVKSLNWKIDARFLTMQKEENANSHIRKRDLFRLCSPNTFCAPPHL